VAALRASLRERCGVISSERVVVGVSGGADSLALLLGLAVIARRSRRNGPTLRPVVVHVHHHLRGRSADLDARAVEREATALGLPCLRRDVHPARERGSRAAAARRLRYAALLDAAEEVGAPLIAVAHHAEDQLESMLMALSRGAGLDGLSAMAWRRPARAIEGRGEGPPWLIRPLLGCSKAECEAFCRLAGRSWRSDPGNSSRTSPRGRLRRSVLPVLESLWPGAARHAVAASEMLREAEAIIAERLPQPIEQGESRIRFLRRDLLATSPLVAGMALRQAALRLRCGGDGSACGPDWDSGLDQVRDQVRNGAPRARGPEHPAGRIRSLDGDAPGFELVALAIRMVRARSTQRLRSLDWPGGLRFRLVGEDALVERIARLEEGSKAGSQAGSKARSKVGSEAGSTGTLSALPLALRSEGRSGE